MKRVSWGLLLFALGCNSSPDSLFDKAVREYKPVINNLSDEEFNSVIILRFGPQKDGNIVVMVARGGDTCISVYSPELLGKIICNGKAHNNHFRPGDKK